MEDGGSVGFCFQDGEGEERFASSKRFLRRSFDVSCRKTVLLGHWGVPFRERDLLQHQLCSSCLGLVPGKGHHPNRTSFSPAAPNRSRAKWFTLLLLLPCLSIKQHFTQKSKMRMSWVEGGKEEDEALLCSWSHPLLGTCGGPRGLLGPPGREPLLHSPFGSCPCHDF